MTSLLALSLPRRGVIAAALMCCSLVAAAAPTAPPENGTAAKSERAIKAQYDKSRQACLAGNTTQSLDDCLNDAAGEARAARKGVVMAEDQDTLTRNAIKRCEVHEGDERALCVRMVQGSAKVSGTVAGGGVLYELTTVVPAAPAAETKKE